MKEKDIKKKIENGESFFVGVRCNELGGKYSVYLISESKEFIDDIQVWAGEGDKTFRDPRKIIPWARKLGLKGIITEDLLFD